MQTLFNALDCFEGVNFDFSSLDDIFSPPPLPEEKIRSCMVTRLTDKIKRMEDIIFYFHHNKLIFENWLSSPEGSSVRECEELKNKILKYEDNYYQYMIVKHGNTVKTGYFFLKYPHETDCYDIIEEQRYRCTENFVSTAFKKFEDNISKIIKNMEHFLLSMRRVHLKFLDFNTSILLL
jgi:hypothetical protein